MVVFYALLFVSVPADQRQQSPVPFPGTLGRVATRLH